MGTLYKQILLYEEKSVRHSANNESKSDRHTDIEKKEMRFFVNRFIQVISTRVLWGVVPRGVSEALFPGSHRSASRLQVYDIANKNV